MLKKALVSIFTVVAINQVVLYPISCVSFLRYSPKMHNTAELSTEKTSVEDYLLSAVKSVHADAIENADCKDYSLATYDRYYQLIHKKGRKDLEGTLRFVTGKYSGHGHMWLEYKQGNEFYSFDPSVPIFDSITEEHRLDSALVSAIYTKSIPGSRWSLPGSDAFDYPGGIIRIALDQ